MDKIKVINGIVKCRRQNSSNCVCCKGNHVFSVYVGNTNSDESIDVNSIINSCLTKDNENKKIKITIEIE